MDLSQADQGVVDNAETIAKRKAAKAAKKAAGEAANRKRALDHQNKQLSESAYTRDESTPPKRRAYADPEEGAVRVGEHVRVQDALRIKGKARHGGEGFVISTVGYGAATRLTVKYDIGGHVESGICIDRVTETPAYSPGFTSSPKRKRTETNILDPSPAQPTRADDDSPPPPIDELLAAKYSAGCKSGWRRRDFAKATRKTLNDEEKAQLRKDMDELSTIKQVEARLNVNTQVRKKR